MSQERGEVMKVQTPTMYSADWDGNWSSEDEVVTTYSALKHAQQNAFEEGVRWAEREMLAFITGKA